MSSMGGGADPQAAAKVSGCLKDLFKLIKATEEARKATEPTLSSISAAHRKVQADGKLTPAAKTKLKSLYEDAAKEASKEEEFLRKSLDKIYQIRQVIQALFMCNICVVFRPFPLENGIPLSISSMGIKRIILPSA